MVQLKGSLMPMCGTHFILHSKPQINQKYSRQIVPIMDPMYTSTFTRVFIDALIHN